MTTPSDSIIHDLMVDMLSRELFDSYDSIKIKEITNRRFTQIEMFSWLQPLETEGLFTKTVLGKSSEGRPISLYAIGSGTINVLIWTQMHGDEPTATMALLDMFNFFAKNPNHIVTKMIREKLTILSIPMLNPDGAERFTRRTAQLVDINRDAISLETPEARILKEIRDKHQPEFGFNLHDQEPRFTVGMSKKITAIALLAPAMDESRTDNIIRLRAKRVASTFARVMNIFIPGRIAKWDDTFEPRAFGDSLQKSGTSTILIESGGSKGDPNKFFLRKLNYVGLLITLYAIATEKYSESDIEIYEQIPFNTELGCDYIIRNALFKVSDHVPPIRVDVGINFEEQIDSVTGRIERFAKIIEFGDLSILAALEEIDACGSELDADRLKLERPFLANELQLLLKRK